jgi:hypothetical protein
MKYAAIVILSAFAASPVIADDAKPQLTVEQCINILYGLNSLNYAGQQFGDPKQAPADAKQYKLGPARMTIAFNVAALTPILTAAQSAQQGFVRELPPLPAAEPGKPDSPERVDAAAKQNKQAQANWEAIIHAPCPFVPGHLKEKELKIGDGPDENAIPPSVLGALVPIIDR